MNKRLIISLAFGIMIVAVWAQTGLFDLYYDAKLETAHQIMLGGGFELIDSRANIGEYRSATNIYVSSILLLADPETSRLAGWMINYNKENTAENDAYVLDKLAALYGKTNHYDEDTEQLIWFLSDTRTVHVMYGKDEDLIVLYYDSRFPGLFERGKR
ncbi:MAG: hypothetical protein U1C33_03490 [Candidatus Cloacimonadaceae bacterium]|nr:hypothetical protein [Candidatus Cloacimonadaceae bacterium]